MSLYAVVDPATGETVREYPTATDAQIEEAITTADQTYQQWSKNTTVAQRAALMKRVAELHTERRDRLAEIIQREMGKSIEEGLGEVDFSAAIF